jgi:hypothetical protein
VVVPCGTVVGALDVVEAEVGTLVVPEVDVELSVVVERGTVDVVVVVARGALVVVRGTVRGVVTFGLASTGCDGTDAGRTRMYSTRVATNTSVTIAVERRTRGRLTAAAPKQWTRRLRAG